MKDNIWRNPITICISSLNIYTMRVSEEIMRSFLHPASNPSKKTRGGIYRSSLYKNPSGIRSSERKNPLQWYRESRWKFITSVQVSLKQLTPDKITCWPSDATGLTCAVFSLNMVLKYSVISDFLYLSCSCCLYLLMLMLMLMLCTCAEWAQRLHACCADFSHL